MQVLQRSSPTLTDEQNAMFSRQPSRIGFIYVERQVGTDRFVYTITYPNEVDTRANRDAFQIFANSQVTKAVQRLIDKPLLDTVGEREERLLQPIEDIGKSL